MNELAYYLPGIILLGLITSYEDYKHGKIRNKWLLLALTYAVIVTISLVVFLLLNNENVRGGYFIEFLANAGLMLIVGALLWKASLWTAGDAKLLFIYSILIPLSVYQYGYVKWFPGNILMINTFVPLGLYFAALTLLKTSLKEKYEALKRLLTLKNLVIMFLAVTAFDWLIRVVFMNSVLTSNFFIMLTLLFISIKLLERFTPLKFVYIVATLTLARIILDSHLFTLSTLELILAEFLGLVFIRLFLLDLGNSVFSKEVKLQDLKEGMILGDVIIQNKKGLCEKINLNKVCYFNYLDALSKKPIVKGKLRTEDLELVKELRQKKKISFDTLRVNQSISFAPFLFIGVLLTIIFNGNLFSWLSLFVI